MKPAITPRLKDAICLSVLAILVVIVFWPVLFEDRLLLPTDQFDTMTLPFSSDYGPPQAYNHNLTDALMQSYPWKVGAQKAFRKGEFYYWNPLILNGYPQYASSRQTYDVFNVLLIPFDLPFAFNLILVLELFTAGVGMYVLLRVHGRRRIIALMFSSAWMFNGMFLTHVLNLWAVATFCWVPFALAMLLLYHRENSNAYLLGAGVFLGLAFLGSTLQSALYAFVCFAIVNVVWSMEDPKTTRKVIMSVGIPLAIALGLSAIMWIPAVGLLLEVLKHGTLYSPTHAHPYTITNRLFSFVLLATFFVPEIMGIVRSISLTSLAGLHPLDYSGYIGFIEMLMALWAMFSLRSSEKSVRPYAWLVLCGFLLPIFTPLFAWLYHRFFIVGTLGLTVLGAERLEAFLKVENLRDRGRKWIKWALSLSLAAFGFLVMANLIWNLNPAIHFSIASFLLRNMSGTAYADGNAAWVQARVAGTFEHYFIPSPMMLVPFGMIFIATFLLLRWRKWSLPSTNNLVLALFICSMVQAMFWWRSFIPMLDAKEFPLLPANHSTTFLKDHLGESRAFFDRRGYPGKQYLFLDNLPSLYDIPLISGYESEIPWSFYPQVKQIFPTSPHPKALGLMGVKYLMFVQGVVPSGTLPVADSGSVMIYDDTFVRSRATLNYRSETLSNDSVVLTRIFDENATHDHVLFSASEQVPTILNDSLGTRSGWEAAHIVKEEENVVDIIANPSQPAYLVLSDTYYPGWKCFVDGNEQKIYRANYAMRAVLLSPGPHQISFIFKPFSAFIGAGCSVCTAFIMLILESALYWRRSRRDRSL